MMGRWRIKQLKKGQRASRTSSKKARIYFAYPPENGWPGGEPERNGYRRKG